MRLIRSKFWLSLLYLLTLSSCSNQILDSEIDMKVVAIEISLFEYQTVYKSHTINWYYVEELIFIFQVENLSSDTLVFGAFNRNNREAKWGRYKIDFKNKEFSLITNSQATLLMPSDSSVFLVEAKNTDFELFRSVLSRKEFKNLFYDLIKNAVFIYKPISADYKIVLKEEFNLFSYCRKETHFTIDTNNVEIKIIVPDKPLIDLTIDSIGYPSDEIPVNIKLNNQINEFIY